ncbi:MAG: flavin reductase [Clostridia bacterium]|nr:flavin reductase [Clostridia bacterium]
MRNNNAGLKENGKPNVCFHSWSSFSGDEGGFFAIMPGLGRDTRTYRSIMRTGEFCVNFLGHEYYDACIKTVQDNADDADEFAVGGFTPEESTDIKAPRIAESFLSLECTLGEGDTTAVAVLSVLRTID